MTHEFLSFYVNSFPRSGNTWVRKMLVDLLNPRLHDANPIFSTWFRIVHRARFEPVDYPEVLSAGGYVIKTHLTRPHCRREMPIVYLVRDGRDSLFSYYNYSVKHRGYSESWPSFFERYVVSRDMRTFRERYLAEHMGDWSANCLSYLNEPNVMLIRYEDLLQDTPGNLQAILEWIECRPKIPEEVLCAVVDKHALEIDKKRRRDDRPRGSVGVWKQVYTPAQLREFEARHASVMSLLGYEIESRVGAARSAGN
jgi:hypothetical protein